MSATNSHCVALLLFHLPRYQCAILGDDGSRPIIPSLNVDRCNWLWLCRVHANHPHVSSCLPPLLLGHSGCLAAGGPSLPGDWDSFGSLWAPHWGSCLPHFYTAPALGPLSQCSTYLTGVRHRYLLSNFPPASLLPLLQGIFTHPVDVHRLIHPCGPFVSLF